MKESVNKGRPFYGCARPLGDPLKCTFFMWGDDNNPGQRNPQPPTDFNRRQNDRGGNSNFDNRNNFGNRDNFGSGTNYRARKKCMF